MGGNQSKNKSMHPSIPYASPCFHFAPSAPFLENHPEFGSYSSIAKTKRREFDQDDRPMFGSYPPIANTNITEEYETMEELRERNAVLERSLDDLMLNSTERYETMAEIREREAALDQNFDELMTKIMEGYEIMAEICERNAALEKRIDELMIKSMEGYETMTKITEKRASLETKVDELMMKVETSESVSLNDSKIQGADIESIRKQIPLLEENVSRLRVRIESLELIRCLKDPVVKEVKTVFRRTSERNKAMELEINELKSKVNGLESMSSDVCSSKESNINLETLRNRVTDLENDISSLKKQHEEINSTSFKGSLQDGLQNESSNPHMDDLVGCYALLLFLFFIIVGMLL